jgi:hypothetical protein
MNNRKKTTLKKNKETSSLLLFDLFVDDLKFNSGEIIYPLKSKTINEINKQILLYIGKDKIKIKMALKNFGNGADWSVALIEFFSENNSIKALANIGGLLGLVKVFEGLFKSLQKKNENIKIGFKSAELLALGKVLKQSRSKSQNLKVVLKKEITKNTFGFNEKYFLFIIEKEEKDFLVMIDWEGKIKIFYKI